ncbi:MAG TPA: hypothetical protein VIK86_06815 [Candidatus Paceibacterota bacterium]
MNTKIIFAILSSVVAIFCFIPYILDIFKGTTKPHSYSWFIWTLLQTIGAISMFSIGAGWGITSISIGAVLCGFVFILSFKYGTHNIKNFDVICLLGALIAMIFYFFLHNPIVSVLIITLVDFVGFLPTMRKAYEEPQTETISAYALSSVSSILALFAFSIFTFSNSVYLISLIITNATCAIIIFTRRKILKQN